MAPKSRRSAEMRARLLTPRCGGARTLTSDTGTPVDDADYQIPFPFTGKIDKLTFSIAPPVLTEEDKRKLVEAERAKQDAN